MVLGIKPSPVIANNIKTEESCRVRENWNNQNSQVLQMATYWFVMGEFSIQKAQKSEVRQVAKDVVKSEV